MRCCAEGIATSCNIVNESGPGLICQVKGPQEQYLSIVAEQEPGFKGVLALCHQHGSCRHLVQSCICLQS